MGEKAGEPPVGAAAESSGVEKVGEPAVPGKGVPGDVKSQLEMEVVLPGWSSRYLNKNNNGVLKT